MKVVVLFFVLTSIPTAMAFEQQVYLTEDCLAADVMVYESTTGSADCYFRRGSSTFNPHPIQSDIWACMLSSPSVSAKSIYFSDDIIFESPLSCLGVKGN